MFRGAGIFIWEQWRQTWKALGLVGLSAAVFAVLLWQFNLLVYYIFAKNANLVIGAAHVPALGAMALLFVQENRGRIGFEYSKRLFVTPARTFVLVGAPLVYRLLVVAVFAGVAGWLCAKQAKPFYYPGPAFALSLAAVASLHAWVFLACGYGAATGTAVFAALTAVSVPLVRLVYVALVESLSIPRALPRDYAFPDIGTGYIWASTALVLYWFFAAYWGARRARSEVAEDPVGGLVTVLQRITYIDRNRETFPTREAAQVWFEWRRGAYLFPWLSLGLGLVLVFAFRIAAERIETRFLVAANMLAVAPAIVACLVGYAVTRSSHDYLWFVAARPLPTSLIARARLKAGLKAVFWGYALLMIAFAVVYRLRFPSQSLFASLVEDLRVMTSTDGSFAEGMGMLSIIAFGIVMGTWTLLWLARSIGVFVWLAGVVVSIWFYSTGELYAMDPETGEYATPTSVFIAWMSYLLGAAGIVAIAAAAARRMVKLWVVALILGVWALAYVLVQRVPVVASFANPVIIAAWLLLPFVPLASIPLTIEWQRHR